MTDRLKMNSIQLAVLSLEKQEITSKCFYFIFSNFNFNQYLAIYQMK